MIRNNQNLWQVIKFYIDSYPLDNKSVLTPKMAQYAVSDTRIQTRDSIMYDLIWYDFIMHKFVAKLQSTCGNHENHKKQNQTTTCKIQNTKYRNKAQKEQRIPKATIWGCCWAATHDMEWGYDRIGCSFG